MLKQKRVCPKCQSVIKTLKHSVLCDCGVKIKTVKV